MNDQIEVIELWPHTDECCVCGRETRMDYGLPMYEGEIVPDNWPEWGGFTACRECFLMFKDITQPVAVLEAASRRREVIYGPS